MTKLSFIWRHWKAVFALVLVGVSASVVGCQRPRERVRTGQFDFVDQQVDWQEALDNGFSAANRVDVKPNEKDNNDSVNITGFYSEARVKRELAQRKITLLIGFTSQKSESEEVQHNKVVLEGYLNDQAYGVLSDLNPVSGGKHRLKAVAICTNLEKCDLLLIEVYYLVKGVRHSVQYVFEFQPSQEELAEEEADDEPIVEEIIVDHGEPEPEESAEDQGRYVGLNPLVVQPDFFADLEDHASPIDEANPGCVIGDDGNCLPLVEKPSIGDDSSLPQNPTPSTEENNLPSLPTAEPSEEDVSSAISPTISPVDQLLPDLQAVDSLKSAIAIAPSPAAGSSEISNNELPNQPVASNPPAPADSSSTDYTLVIPPKKPDTPNGDLLVRTGGEAQVQSELFVPAVGNWVDSLAFNLVSGGAPNGHFNRGTLKSASSLEPLETDCYKKYNSGSHYGTGLTIDFIDRMCREFQKYFPSMRWELTGISKRKGGPFGSHKSHQTGMEFDILYFNANNKSVVSGGKVNSYFNAESVWKAMSLMVETGHVLRFFVNQPIKSYMCRWAKDKNLTSPRDQETLRRITTWSGHNQHFHVRLKCPDGRIYPHYAFCKVKAGDELPPGTGCGAFGVDI